MCTNCDPVVAALREAAENYAINVVRQKHSVAHNSNPFVCEPTQFINGELVVDVYWENDNGATISRYIRFTLAEMLVSLGGNHAN